MRGAIRRPEFEGQFQVFLYDLAQAEALRTYFVEAGITEDVTLVPVIEAGIMDVTREGRNGGDKIDTSVQAGRAEKKRADAAARQRRSRARKRAANGVARRGAGRPSKV
jgi:hypothetical protein